MQKQFATYEIALKLKELGFNEECLVCYSPHLGNGVFELTSKGSSNEKSSFNERFIKAGSVNGCSAPLWQQVIDWFREEKLLELIWLPQDKSSCDPLPLYFIAIVSYEGGTMRELFNSTEKSDLLHFISPEDAREQVILKAIELCQNKK